MMDPFEQLAQLRIEVDHLVAAAAVAEALTTNGYHITFITDTGVNFRDRGPVMVSTVVITVQEGDNAIVIMPASIAHQHIKVTIFAPAHHRPNLGTTLPVMFLNAEYKSEQLNKWIKKHSKWLRYRRAT